MSVEHFVGADNLAMSAVWGLAYFSLGSPCTGLGSERGSQIKKGVRGQEATSGSNLEKTVRYLIHIITYLVLQPNN